MVKEKGSTNASRYFDDEAWPVQAAVAALGVLLIGLIAQQQPSDVSQWPISAWITVGKVGLITIAAMAGASLIEPRMVRRPLQLALVLCLIVHAILVVQMVHARLQTGSQLERTSKPTSHGGREQKLVADYRPVEHLPEESRPQQDFERPVEAETSLNRDERGEMARQNLERDAPEAPVTTPTMVENELRPQAAEFDRKPNSEQPEMPLPQLQEIPRDLAEMQRPTTETIELPFAAVDVAPAMEEIQAATAAINRREAAAAPLAAQTGVSELPLQPEVVPQRPTNELRRIPVYERPRASISADEPATSNSPRTARAAAVPAAEIVALPVLERAAVEQAMSDHRPVFSSARRSTVERPPVRQPAMEIGKSEASATITARESLQPAVKSRPRRPDAIDGNLLTPQAASGITRQSRAVAPPAATSVVVPREAFSGRAARLRSGSRPDAGGLVLESEDAIELGLMFLARHQRVDGSWSLQGFPEEAALVSDTAATALAVMAFQGAGYNHRELAYHSVVARGLAFLVNTQKENGDLFVPLHDASNKSVWLYSHALATIAVCEAYGMTQDATLREPAQRAIDFIVAAQQKERGGWRYFPAVGADTSVSGWMTMALKSGELAGLSVPPAIFSKIGHWLDTAQQSASSPHLYCYNPYAPDSPEQRHGRVASKTMTAVGLLMRLYTGWRPDDSNLARGASYLAANLPSDGNVRQSERDTYYWYYATQVMAQVGGEKRQAWSERLQPLLVKSQVRRGPLEGSWDPLLPIADRWGPQAGRLYVTAMNLLSLEVEWRKLPVPE